MISSCLVELVCLLLLLLDFFSTIVVNSNTSAGCEYIRGSCGPDRVDCCESVYLQWRRYSTMVTVFLLDGWRESAIYFLWRAGESCFHAVSCLTHCSLTVHSHRLDNAATDDTAPPAAHCRRTVVSI